MAHTQFTITQGTAPFTVVVTDNANGNPVTCTAGCGSSSVTARSIYFTPLAGSHVYRIRVTDSSTPTPCSYNLLTDTINCDPPGTPVPSFTFSLTQPVCSGGSLSNASYTLTDLTNATHYGLYAGTTASCISVALPGGPTFTGSITPPAANNSQAYILRVFNGTDCSVYTDYSFTVTSPSCSPTQTCTLTLTLGSVDCTTASS